MDTITLCTRGSLLATTQTGIVITALKGAGYAAVPEIIKTRGDMKQGTAQAGDGDKRDWIHELEVAVAEGTADIAIHSGKDIPAEIDDRTRLIPVLTREDPTDYFIGKQGKDGSRRSFESLTADDLVGTASLRRQATLKGLIPGVSVTSVRGNVGTRLQKLADSRELSGIILAGSGLIRLDLVEASFERLVPEVFCPAVHQGMLVAQVHRDRRDLIEALSGLVDSAAERAFWIERACIEKLEGDCHTAVGLYSVMDDTTDGLFHTRAFVYDADGTKACSIIEEAMISTKEQAMEQGTRYADALLAQGAAQVIAACRDQKLKPQ